MKTLQYSTAGLSIGVGTYDIVQIGKENYQKYVVRGEDFSLGDMFSDLFRGAMDVVSIAGGAKLAQADIPYCFVAGTLIATADGYKPIEEIQAGDKVLSENPETGEIAYKTVEETYINETDELIHVHVNGETISATPNHPFYVDKLGWTLAKNLRAGDILVLSNGEFVVVEWIQHEILENPVKVYNFKVEDFHTYFVGESSVLVHNQCPNNRKEQQRKNYKEYTGHEATGEVHHGLPEEHRTWFESHGVTDIDNGKYYFDIPKDKHRLKVGEGIHTNNNAAGMTWNASLSEFITNNPNANLSEIEQKLDELAELYEIIDYRAIKKG